MTNPRSSSVGTARSQARQRHRSPSGNVDSGQISPTGAPLSDLSHNAVIGWA
jgi:hypothetical protein